MYKNISIEDLGQYWNGFFRIQLNQSGINFSEDNIAYSWWEEFNDHEKSTFLHEYIHYLQEISTTSGLIKIENMFKFIQLNLHEIANSPQTVIEIPIPLEEIKESSAFEAIELNSFYEGNESHIKIHHISDIKLEVDETIKDILNSKVPEDDLSIACSGIKIHYDDEKCYLFGRVCIAESMAYLIEKQVFKTTNYQKEFPYNACELVCDFYYKEFAKYPIYLIALCEISLMHPNSGCFFVHALEKMKKEKYIPNSFNKLALYLKQRIPFLYDDMQKTYLGSIDSLNELCSYDTQLKSKNNYIKEILQVGVKHRRKDIVFISRIIRYKPRRKFNKHFFEILRTFKLPIITDKHNNTACSPELLICLAFNALYSLFSPTTGIDCPLYVYCKKNNVSSINNSCLESPWEQVQKNELCLLASYWYRFSLAEKQIKSKYK